MNRISPLLCISLVMLCLGFGWAPAAAAPAAQTPPDDGPPRILLPTVPGGANQSPPPIAEDGRVYGLLGTLQIATDQPFSTYLISADGRVVGLVGSTPAVEADIARIRGAGGVEAKVWGIYQPATSELTPPQIIVTDILPVEPAAPAPEVPAPETPAPETPAEVPPVATPMPEAPAPETVPAPSDDALGQDKAVIIVMFDLVNVRTGPGNRFPPSGQVVKDQVCDIVGRNELETWYLADCLGGARGWIDKRLIQVQGNTEPVPVLGETVDASVITPTPGILPPQPTPSPTPDVVPAPVDYWKVTFFNNPQLLPPVALDATAGDVNFNWGTSSPHPTVTSVNFSARFERAIDFAAGFYRILTQADDGVRIYLDGQLLIDEWHGSTGEIFAVSRYLSGRHVMTVEYYQASGASSIRVWQEYLGNTPAWQAQYFGGIELQGVPVLEQPEASGNGRPLDYSWGANSPMPERLAGDFWSGRWTGEFQFESGNYIFNVISDDGARLYLNDTLVIDRWYDGYMQSSKQFIGVGADRHTVRVEFYERSGNALLQVWWYREAGQQIAP